MPFTPLDSSAIFSTVFLEGPMVWAVWTAILSSSSADGITALNPRTLATLWKVDENAVQAAWDILASEDPNSKNKEFQGRRIIQLDDGQWFIVSHQKYRNQTSDTRRAQIRESKRRQRAREKGLNVECKTCKGWVANPGDEFCTACSFPEEK